MVEPDGIQAEMVALARAAVASTRALKSVTSSSIATIGEPS